MHQNEDFEHLCYDLVNVSVVLQHVKKDILDSNSAKHAYGLLVSQHKSSQLQSLSLVKNLERLVFETNHDKSDYLTLF